MHIVFTQQVTANRWLNQRYLACGSREPLCYMVVASLIVAAEPAVSTVARFLVAVGRGVVGASLGVAVKNVGVLETDETIVAIVIGTRHLLLQCRSSGRCHAYVGCCRR